MDKSGYVYIFSNSEYSGLLKIGKSKKNPVIRADQLTRNTGAIGSFKLEWYQEVPEMDIAETLLHFTFRQFHDQKEFFKIDSNKASKIAIVALDSFFALDNKLQLEMKMTSEINNCEMSNAEIDDLTKLAIELEKELNNLDI
jgi:hypothetical protein